MYINYKSIIVTHHVDYCISLIIPSTEDDFLRCYKQFFYLSKSFILAKEIVLVISSVTNSTKLQYIIQKLSIRKKIILSTRMSKQNAASNRNYGFKLSTCSIVSFFDIDDLMSVNRLAILFNVLKYDKTTEFILHKYTSNCRKMKEIVNINNSVKYKYNLTYQYIYKLYRKKSNKEHSHQRWCCKYIDDIKHESIHNGWPTMRRYIFNKIKYNSSYNIGQDSDFNSNVILNGFNTTILNISLGFYKKDNLCLNYKLCF